MLLYFPEPAQRQRGIAAESALSLRTKIFDRMCAARSIRPAELTGMPDAHLLLLYANCAKGLAKQTDVSIEQLRVRINEYAAAAEQE